MGQQHLTLSHPLWRSLACSVVAMGASMSLAAPQAAAVPPPDLEWSVPAAGRGTPASDGQTAYFLTRDHAVVAVSLEGGVERWRRPTQGPGPVTSGSRLVVSGQVVVAADTDLVAFDRVTGERRWTFGAVERRSAGLYLGDSDAGLVFAGSPAGFLQAVEAGSGRPRWMHAVTTGTVFAPALINPGMVAVGFTDRGTPRRGGIAAFDAGTGRELWRRTFLPWTGVGSSTGAAGIPVACGSVVILGSEEGTLYGLDPNGGHVRWVIPPLDARPDHGEPPARDYRPVACSEPTLITGSLTGQVVAYDVHTRRERWRRAPEAASVAFGLSVDAESVFVPYLSGHLLALSLADGTVRWRAGGPSAGLVWTPLIHDSRLLVTGSGAGLMAFRR